jgi:hypothetical protein
MRWRRSACSRTRSWTSSGSFSKGKVCIGGAWDESDWTVDGLGGRSVVGSDDGNVRFPRATKSERDPVMLFGSEILRALLSR